MLPLCEKKKSPVNVASKIQWIAECKWGLHGTNLNADGALPVRWAMYFI